MKKYLLYGANGYTGRLIVKMAAQRGMSLTIAGRNEKEIMELAKESDLPYLIFDLNDVARVKAAIKGFKVVLHVAGPFIHTALPMMKACLAESVHYLDITGEIPVFEQAATLDSEAQRAGIMLMSGVGFDVVPTDCMAAYLHSLLPGAVSLELAFANRGGRISHGTALTAVENLGEQGAERVKTKIEKVPIGKHTRVIPFASGEERFSMSIPWGDVSTAYYTTGIPNIRTYMAIHPSSYKKMQWATRYFSFILQAEWVKNIIRKRIKQGPAGPDEQMHKTAYTLIWGEVRDASGQTKAARMKVPEGYILTAMSSLYILSKEPDGLFRSGFQTPAGLFGHQLIHEICGTNFEDIF